MQVLIRTIPHQTQWYNTVGDWIWSEDGHLLTINVSETGDWRYDMLVALHELVEVVLCKDRGITQESVDYFDRDFEERRKHGEVPEDAEPGDAIEAPYYEQHQIASVVERLLATAMKIHWHAYDEKLASFDNDK